MLKNFLVVAWRNIVRHKGNSFIHIFGLGVGICACMAIWAITHYELSFDKFHPDGDRIYRLVSEFKEASGDTAHWGELPEPAVGELRKALTGLEAVAQFHNINPMIAIPALHGQLKKIPSVEGDVYNDIVLAEPQYFDIFSYHWLAGNAASLREPFHVVISAKEAERYFGSQDWANILGRTIVYDDSIRTTVTGIVEGFDQITDFQFKDFISYATARAAGLTQNLQLDDWGNFNTSSETFVKLDNGVSPTRIEAELKTAMSPHLAQMVGTAKDAYYRVRLQPLADLHYSSLYEKDYGSMADMKTLYKLMGVAAFILILASINFINLSTAQSLRRSKEIGVRKVLGSRRIGLVAQFMTETILLALAALLLSLLLLRPLLGLFPDFVPAGLVVNVIDPATIGFALLVVLLAAILSGLYPAVVLASIQPAQTLKGQGGSPRNWGSRLGKGLVVFQFTISAVFIISAIVIGDQMHYMLHRDMGFSRDAVIRMDVQEDAPYAKRRLLADRLRALPGVGLVSMDYSSPVLHGWWRTHIEYLPAAFKGDVDVRAADTNYLSMYGLKLLAGRNYFPSDTMREIVINELFARQLGYRRPQDAVGHTVPMWSKNPMIAGVVANFNARSLQYGYNPLVIIPRIESETGYSVKLHTRGLTAAQVQQTIAAIGKDWVDAFPEEPFRYQWMDEYIAKLYASETKTASLINLAMIITIVVSGMGLFGLAALAAGRRTKEIGIRKVLGAGLVDITMLVSRDFVLLVGIALVIASPVAWYFLHDWLQNYVFRVSIGWWVFGLAAVLAVGVAVLTVGFHAVRAGMANPVKSLRAE
jgi:putative ABC transport system permease protein